MTKGYNERNNARSFQSLVRADRAETKVNESYVNNEPRVSSVFFKEV